MFTFIFKIKKTFFLIFLITLIVCSFSMPRETALYFSPNGDGDRDTILLSHEVLKNPKITNWTIKVLQLNVNKLKIIKTYDSKDYLDQKSVFWDGKQEQTSDKKEIDCSEGLYLYFVEAIDEDGQKITTPFRKVFLDKDPSVNKVTIISDFFSPNGDGEKEELELHLKMSYYGVFDTIKLIFLNEDKNGKIVNEILFKGNDFLKKNHQFSFYWDGKDKSGQLLEEGNYSVFLKGKDLANNKSISKKQFFKIFINPPKVSFENPRYFSKKKGGEKELPLVFNIQRESQRNLDYETLSIVNKKINTVIFSQKRATFKKTFAFKQANQLREGVYVANLKTFYKTGFRVKSQSTFIIDNTLPKIFVEKNRNVFVISEDPTLQDKEGIVFTYKLIDKNLHSLKFRVLKDAPKNKKVVFSEEEWFEGDVIFKAKSVFEKKWHWNGYDQTGTKVKTGNYIYELKVTDKAGNEALVRTKAFRVCKEKAKGNVETKTKYISLNGDNVLDALKLNFSFPKASRQIFKDGKIVFYKKNGTGVKKVVYEEKVKDLLKKERVYSFKNQKLQDGEYGYDSEFWFDGAQVLKFTGSFVIDNTKPKVTLNHDATSFITDKTSLTGNRSINFYQETQDRNVKSINLKIFSSKTNKRQVFLSKNYEITPENKESFQEEWSFNWAGLDNKGESVVGGNYIYELKVTDKAGNEALVRTKAFRVCKEKAKGNVETKTKYISLNGDNVLDALKLNFSFPKASRQIFKDGKIVFYKKNGTGVKKVVYEEKVKDLLKKERVYSFKNQKLQDGEYGYDSEFWFDGAQVLKFTGSFVIDNTKPKVTLNHDATSFITDKTSLTGNRSINFYQETQDRNVKSINLKIFSSKTNKRQVFLSKNYEITPENKESFQEEWSFNWAGLDNKGESVVGGNYIYELKVTDKAGNEALVRTKAFRVCKEKAKGNVETKTKYISLNGDNVLDALKLNFSFPKASRQIFKDGKIVFYKKNGTGVKKVVYEEKVKDLLKKERVYSFKNQKLQDGEYGYDSEFWFDGAQVLKFTGSFVIDNTKPKVTLNHDATSFITDKTSLTGNRSINFYQETQDRNVKSINLKIFSSKTNKRQVFLSKNYEITPENKESFQEEWSFNWAGLDNKGESVVGGNYIYELKVTDKAGNEALVRTKAFRVCKEKAKGNVETKTKYISLNGDNVLDALKLNFSFPKASRQIFKDGKIVFYKKNGTGVKKVVYEEKVKDLLKKERVYSFKNQKLQDGEYGYDSEFWFDGAQVLKFTGSFVIDNTKPKVTLNHDVTSFITDKTSLTGNRSINFYQETQDRNVKSINLKIFSSKTNKRQVFLSKNYEITPENKESFQEEWSFNWAGLDNKGESVVGGNYIYELKVTDKAGNEALVRTKAFRVFAKKVNVSVSSELVRISPNGDGEKDYFTVSFNLPLETRKRFLRGFLRVFKGDRVIKKYELKNDVEGVNYPDNNKTPFPYSDGTDYKYEYSLFFDGNENLTTSRFFVVDTEPLKLNFSFKNLYFSPNGDGFNEQFELDIAKEDFKKWRKGNAVWIEVKDQKGKTVTLEGMNFDLRKCVWKGKDDNRKDVPEGTYFIRLITKDGGNNVWSSEALKVILIRKNVANLKLFFSEGEGYFNLKAEKNPIKLLSTLDNFKYFEGIDYYFTFRNRRNRKIITNIISYKKPSSIILNKNLEEAFWREDNVYKIWAVAKYKHRINIVSKKIKLIVDSKPPVIFLKASGKFKPSVEVENLNQLTIGVESEDNQSVGKTELLIYQNAPKFNFRKGETNQAKFLKSFDEDPLQVWEWEGSVLTNLLYVAWDDKKKGKNLKTGQEYAIVLKTTDAAGNVKLVSKKIKVGFLVETTQDGKFRIIINTVNFVFDSDKMVGDYQKILTRILDVLVSFKGYNILIVGHTDSRGSDEYNQKLSEKRSKAVYNYFIKSGVEPSTLSFLGKGKKELLVKQEVIRRSRFSSSERKKLTELNYLKNRRVEFFLVNEHKKNTDVQDK